MKTPDRPVSPQSPGKGPAEGTTSYPLGGRPHPALPDTGRPDTRPLPARPNDHVRGR
jgi:hypothetical protein